MCIKAQFETIIIGKTVQGKYVLMIERYYTVVMKVQSIQNLNRTAKTPINIVRNPRFQAIPIKLEGNSLTLALRQLKPYMKIPNQAMSKRTTKPVKVYGGSIRVAGALVSISLRVLYYKADCGIELMAFLNAILQFAILLLRFSVNKSSLIMTSSWQLPEIALICSFDKILLTGLPRSIVALYFQSVSLYIAKTGSVAPSNYWFLNLKAKNSGIKEGLLNQTYIEF